MTSCSLLNRLLPPGGRQAQKRELHFKPNTKVAKGGMVDGGPRKGPGRNPH